MTCKPVLTPEQMADFLMNHYSPTVPENIRNDYRKRCLILLEQEHEPEYAKAVRKILESKYREKRKNASSSK